MTSAARAFIVACQFRCFRSDGPRFEPLNFRSGSGMETLIDNVTLGADFEGRQVAQGDDVTGLPFVVSALKMRDE